MKITNKSKKSKAKGKRAPKKIPSKFAKPTIGRR